MDRPSSPNVARNERQPPPFPPRSQQGSGVAPEESSAIPVFVAGAEEGAAPHAAPSIWSEPLPASPPAPPTSSDRSAPWGELSGDSVPSGTTDDATPRRTGRVVPLFLAALLGAVVGTGATFVAANRYGLGKSAAGVVRVVAPVPGGSKSAPSEGVAGVAAAVSPSIVQISVQSTDQFGRGTLGTGSGVIYRSDGYIITNNHVIEGARSVQVTLSTGDQLEGRVIGTAMPVDDIAVVKVDRRDLPAATLGSIADTRVGETAVAIGSPFGFQSTVTAGIVSALHRNVDLGEERFTEAIQTDAPINPGNSGGALVNGKGAVIGINTAIVGGQGGNVGIGFAIPIDIAKRDADEIIDTGHASRPLLGVVPETVPGQDGGYVAQVTAGTPAGTAGIEKGDLITKIGGVAIHSGEDLILAVAKQRIGDKVAIEFTRNGKTMKVTVTLIGRTR